MDDARQELLLDPVQQLAGISAANATRLRPMWTFSTEPLVVKNTMYVVTPWPNVLYAFDLTQEGYPLKWKYRPDVSSNAIGEACCDVINRGAFYADGKIIYNLLDGHTVAIDAESGKELWKTQIADLGEGETTPMAPFVVKDRVIVGASGGEFGIYGFVKGLEEVVHLKDQVRSVRYVQETGRRWWCGPGERGEADVLTAAASAPGAPVRSRPSC
ncbi:MAG TPA: PQQ-binding-like beta-propeller repeat protein [Gemmatimonadales bacterium]|nr:PQQ-binding-like beta-propeller repeat protein [Gemmatimonadales bacterium]